MDPEHNNAGKYLAAVKAKIEAAAEAAEAVKDGGEATAKGDGEAKGEAKGEGAGGAKGEAKGEGAGGAKGEGGESGDIDDDIREGEDGGGAAPAVGGDGGGKMVEIVVSGELKHASKKRRK